jgi:hypothetical protein
MRLRAGQTTVMRGDTAWFELSLTNHADTAVVVTQPYVANSNGFDPADYCQTWVAFTGARQSISSCAGALGPVGIPAHGTVVRRAPFTGFLSDPGGCLDTGTYGVVAGRFLRDADSLVYPSGGGVIGSTTAVIAYSNRVRVELHDVAESAQCPHLAAGKVPPCTDRVTPAASSGPTPTFTWTPACRLGELQVFDSETAVVVWRIRSLSAGVAPGVRYGIVPAGSRALIEARPLVPGHHYVVTTSGLWDYMFEVNGGGAFTP